MALAGSHRNEGQYPAEHHSLAETSFNLVSSAINNIPKHVVETNVVVPKIQEHNASIPTDVGTSVSLPYFRTISSDVCLVVLRPRSIHKYSK